MTGRYLESLIQARHMGISGPELSLAEWRLQTNPFHSLGSDGLVHDPSGAIVHSFSQGSALFGLLAWFEDTGDARVRLVLERLITAQLGRTQRQGDWRVDPTVQLRRSSGSHLAEHQIFPAVRFYELTGYPDALKLAEGLTRRALANPVVSEGGTATLPLSWEGHLHSWLETFAGCVRTVRHFSTLDRAKVVARGRALYDWVQRSNATSFGWIATLPTHGSCETCAISSAIRLALELLAVGYPEYLDDVERFVRSQVVEAQFRDLNAYDDGTNRANALLIGSFDSQSLPNGHLGTRGREDVGTVEGCCLDGGLRALASGWDAIAVSDEHGLMGQLGLSRNGPGGEVIGYQPFEGRVDVIPRAPGSVEVRVPRWAQPTAVSVFVDEQPVAFMWKRNFIALPFVRAGQRVSVRYPLRELEEDVVAGGQRYRVKWRGDVVLKVDPPGKRESCYEGRMSLPQAAEKQERCSAAGELSKADPRATSAPARGRQDIPSLVPDTYILQDAARLAGQSMLARLDLQRGGQPFFRIYPFADPLRAEHEKWDDGDLAGCYVEALILARRLTGLPIDSREPLLRCYLAGLFDPKDGLCYTQGTDWTPRRACLFSQSSAMLGLLAWYRETGSTAARRLLGQHVAGVMRLAVIRTNYACFSKYEWDGTQWMEEPKGKDAPPWHGGRLILPLVEYWSLRGREESPSVSPGNTPSRLGPGADDIQAFLEKLIRYVVEVSTFIKPDGAVERGEGWRGWNRAVRDAYSTLSAHISWTRRRRWVRRGIRSIE